MAVIIDSENSIRLLEMLSQYQVNATGGMQNQKFQSMLTINLRLRPEEAQNLIYHYDPQGRQEIRV